MQRLRPSLRADSSQVTVRGADPATAALEFELYTHDSDYLLPLRPVLVGGDDLTFVCDGRVAFDLAVAALEAFEATEIPLLGHIHACAGIAICRTHTPFARAYDLASNLCANAKSWLRHKKIEASALDWHLGSVPPGATVGDLRDGYTTDTQREEPDLTCRPYVLAAEARSEATWSWLRDDVLGTANSGLRGPFWRERRNKALALGEVVTGGALAVREVLAAWKAVDDDVPLPSRLRDGFLNGRTPLLDARELLDLYLPLLKEDG